MHFIALKSFIHELLGLGLRVLLLYLGFRLIGISWGIVAASVVNSIVSLAILFRWFFIPQVLHRFSDFTKIISKSLPYYFTSVLAILNKRVSVDLLGILSDDVSVALFSAAYTFIPKFAFIASSLVGAAFPAMNRLFSEDKRK